MITNVQGTIWEVNVMPPAAENCLSWVVTIAMHWLKLLEAYLALVQVRETCGSFPICRAYMTACTIAYIAVMRMRPGWANCSS